MANHLSLVGKAQAFRILAKTASYGFTLPFKILNEQKIFRTRLNPGQRGDRFVLMSQQDELQHNPEVAIKLMFESQVFFLRTSIKYADGQYYFDNYEHLYELVRRKKPRFVIPELWSQSASFYNLAPDSKGNVMDAEIVEMSSIGMQLRFGGRSDVKKGHKVRLKFKVFRRAEVSIEAKVIYIKEYASRLKAMGVEFSGDSTLALNKIQNVCEDLAFFYAAEKNE